MSSKKILSHLEPQQESTPRFNRIVLIDDSGVDLFINEAILKTISLTREIKKIFYPEKFLKQLSKANRLSDVPELIFLDLDMEGMDGFNFLEKFGKLSDFIRNKCKIVIVTSSPAKEDKFRALMNPSVIRYLIKPLDVYHLRDFIYS